MSINKRYESKIMLFKIIFAIFLFALLFSVFHCHKNSTVYENSCLLCSFSAMITAAAVSWFVLLLFTILFLLFIFKIARNRFEAFIHFCEPRAPPLN